MDPAVADEGTASRKSSPVRIERGNIACCRGNNRTVEIYQMCMTARKPVVPDTVRIVTNRTWRLLTYYMYIVKRKTLIPQYTALIMTPVAEAVALETL